MPTSPATTSRAAIIHGNNITAAHTTTTTSTVRHDEPIPIDNTLPRQNQRHIFMASLLVTLCSLTCLIAFVVVYVVYVVMSFQHMSEQTNGMHWEGFYSWPLYVVIVSVVLFIVSLILLIKRYQLMVRRRMEQHQQAEAHRMEMERTLTTISVPTTISGSGTLVEMKIPPSHGNHATSTETRQDEQQQQPSYVMREPGVVMPSSTSVTQPIPLGVNQESQAVQYTFNNNLPPSIV
ncbi:hypothetical protein C9374_012883 [Naegleria lovaniensis]|uniref:Uncharacterized protein n=1 Tax=Naegleria lovaniensis TaxID=51637 RepID=A0AA88G7C0_NAELO|nr:uncharacterized protein C9374_012883 [Naegleria lovaniensis]KAG2373037.1 hypothetical protein C9374_012883 [Naegleria lovaniensis]